MTDVETKWWPGDPPVRVDGEISALRAWELVLRREGRELRLSSLTRPVMWPGPVFHAGQPPQRQNSDGIYAVKPTLTGRRELRSSIYHNVWVRGWVGLYGHVVEHENGYRAEHAVIRRLKLCARAYLHLTDDQKVADVIRELEQTYHCPVETDLYDLRKATRSLTFRGAGTPVHSGPRVMDEPLPPAPVRPPPAPVASPPPAPVDTERRRRSTPGYSPDGISYASLVRAFQRAEKQVMQELPRNYRFWHTVSLASHYSRAVRQHVKCCMVGRGFGYNYVYPRPIVQRAARILRIPAALLLPR